MLSIANGVSVQMLKAKFMDQWVNQQCGYSANVNLQGNVAIQPTLIAAMLLITPLLGSTEGLSPQLAGKSLHVG